MQAKMNFNTSIDINQALSVIDAQYDYRWSNFCATHAQAADYFCVAAQDLKVAKVCDIGHLPQGDRVRALTITLFATIDFLGVDWVAENLINLPYLHAATFYKIAGEVPSWVGQKLSAAELEISVINTRAVVAKQFEIEPATPVISDNIVPVVTDLDSVEITETEAAVVEQGVEDAAQDPVEKVEEEGASDEESPPAPIPVVVDLDFSAEEANAKYGDRYGIDWVYEGENE